nr:MAG TPA: Transcription factor AP-1/DNA Complex, Zebra, BZLF-1, AP-1, Epstein-Barr [Caudoviricetes sp.]
MLERKIHGLECELVVLSTENMNLSSKVGDIKSELNTLSQALKRHEDACSENIEQTNKEFEAIRQDMKRSKKSFFKR